MKIEDLVLSIEQMNYLKELGLEFKDTALCWVGKLKYEFSVNPHTVFSVEVNKGKQWQYNGIVTEHIPTLTLQEILEMLPKVVDEDYYLVQSHNNIEYSSMRNGIKVSFDWTFFDSDAPYKMLCWVAENGYLNNKENENN